MALQTYIAKSGQSFFDICLQTYRSLNLLYKLAKDNNVGNIYSGLYAGLPFTFDTALIKDRTLFDNNVSNNIVYATADVSAQGLLTEDGESILTEGGQPLIP